MKEEHSMPENTTRPYDFASHVAGRDGGAESASSPTLADEFLHSACTLARGRMSWTPGPGHHTEDLPWLKGATAA